MSDKLQFVASLLTELFADIDKLKFIGHSYSELSYMKVDRYWFQSSLTRLLYSPDNRNALTISALTKSPLN